MDWIAVKENAGKQFGKYKYALLILAVGLLLMSLPIKEDGQEEVTDIPPAVSQESLEDRLSLILSRIRGVGEVQVLLTEESGPESVFQTDEDQDRVDTVIISDGDRAQSGLVKKTLPPVYQGAIVVCQGGGSASVRLSVVEAVSNVTGIPTSRITVLEMN